VRPKKSTAERKRREATQKKRLIALGADAVKVSKMGGSELRQNLKRPAKIAK
jgi:hypothetical protein